jgi:molybdate transport system substrate-binding protein
MKLMMTEIATVVRSWILGMACLLGVTACMDGEDPAKTVQAQPAEMLIYCGITMAPPMGEIARNFEKQHKVHITISQGGSEDLYQSLKGSRKGDLFLAGSASYREKNLKEGLLGEAVHVGYNQSALMVAKGNPKKITGDLDNLTRKDLAVVICSPDSGSIGRETKLVLEKRGIYQQVKDNAAYLTTDSRNLNQALKKGDADLIINWRATAFFPDNSGYMDMVEIDPVYAVPKKLLLNQLTFSPNPELSKKFMEYAASAEGQAIFRKWGFIDNSVMFDK